MFPEVHTRRFFFFYFWIAAVWLVVVVARNFRSETRARAVDDAGENGERRGLKTRGGKLKHFPAVRREPDGGVQRPLLFVYEPLSLSQDGEDEGGGREEEV